MARSEGPFEGRRGATLSLLAVTVSGILIALGTAYLAASEHAFRLAAVRERRAKALAAAEAAIELGLLKVTAATPAMQGEERLANGALAVWEIAPEDGARVRVRGIGAFGEGPDRIALGLSAEVERPEGRRPRVVRVLPD